MDKSGFSRLLPEEAGRISGSNCTGGTRLPLTRILAFNGRPTSHISSTSHISHTSHILHPATPRYRYSGAHKPRQLPPSFGERACRREQKFGKIVKTVSGPFFFFTPRLLNSIPLLPLLPFSALHPLPTVMAPRRNAQSTAAELSLVQLQKCFVNLPSSLVNLLMSIDTVSPRNPGEKHTDKTRLLT